MTAVMGASAYGVLVQDRETGKGYAMHPQCLETLRGMLTDAGCSAWRMVEMGPATTDPADVCNFGTCGAPLSGEAVTR